VILGGIVFVKGMAVALMPFNTAWVWLATMVSLRVVSAKAQDAIMNRLTLSWLKANHRLNYGAVRFWGALSFAATSMLAGMLARQKSVAVLFPIAGVMGTLAVFFVGAFPERIAERSSVENALEKRPKRSPQLLFVFLIIFLFALGSSGVETFAYVFLSEELDAGTDLIGLLGAVAGLAPLPAFYIADWLISRRGGNRHHVYQPWPF
jgi:hypothetical protein